MIFNNFNDEYKYFIEKHLLPILGISKNNNIIPCNEDNFNTSVSIKDNYIYFATHSKKAIYKLYYPKGLTKDALNLSINISQVFLNTSTFTPQKSGKKIKFSDAQIQNNQLYAVQKGLCNWILGRENASVEKLFDILNKWSVKTYEGKKVTFGFIINPNVVSCFDNVFGDWLDYLQEDFSATLTDSIHSVIELDKNCNFNNYLSLTENNIINSLSINNFLPIRFCGIVQNYVKDNKIGVFLLTSGDIILSKNQRICFVKRNLCWLNFSYESFVNSCSMFVSQYLINDKLVENIYASMLDVSFSHTGGIIAVVTDIKELTNGSNSILDACDDLTNNYTLEKLSEKLLNKEEKTKRLLKRKILNTLSRKKQFIDIDRKLRSELISMDGACIIDTKGQVCAFGAIIQNDKGSSGGGRGAAAKKLSKYGMAIKISTDGYIEIYINESLKYSIK